MNLYLLKPIEKLDNYNTYDSVVVVANNEEEAKGIHPHYEGGWNPPSPVWVSSPDKVSAELIGWANNEKFQKPGIVLGSFNAG